MNQKILKGIAIVALMPFLAGCDEIKFNGDVNINEPITFAGQNRVNVVVNPGQFSAKATIGKSGKKKQIKLEIKNANPATTVQLEFDKNINIGENFILSASQIGQNFDLAGTMFTKVERGNEQWGRESCTYQEPHTVCRSGAKSTGDVTEGTIVADLASFAQGSDKDVPEASNPVMAERGHPNPGHFNNPPHTPVCHTQWVSRPGWMDVRYYIETTMRDLNVNFVQGDKSLGAYKGNSSVSERVYTYQGRCGW